MSKIIFQNNNKTTFGKLERLKQKKKRHFYKLENLKLHRRKRFKSKLRLEQIQKIGQESENKM